MEAGVNEFKQRARATWAAGDFDAVATRTIWTMGPRLVDRVVVEPGMRVLDVGCGTGNVAIPAALAGARVTGLDLTPELFDAARRHAGDAGVQVEWIEGDAEARPFEDGSFDRVFSNFGAIFAPRHAVAAAELVRVLAPGGALAMTAWTPDGLNGQMFQTLGKHMPPPPPFAQPPFLWGDEGHVREMFGPLGVELEIDREVILFKDESVEAATRFMEENLGPVKLARAALGDGWAEVRQELVATNERFNQATDGTAEAPAEYLLIVARRPAG